MSQNDFSDYFSDPTNKNAIRPVYQTKMPGDKRTKIYLAVIVLCFIGFILLFFKSGIFKNTRPASETLPPGVPFEAPPLDQLPGG